MFIRKKDFDHIRHMATKTCMELQRVEVELEEEKRARALAQAMAEGYANMTMKITTCIIVTIIIAFAWYLGDLASDYREGIRLVAQGEYEEAAEIFEKLGDYKDSEVLADYCRVMAEYDSFDYASVFRTYHDLQDINVDNEAIALEVATNRAEIDALYVHVGGVLYG